MGIIIGTGEWTTLPRIVSAVEILNSKGLQHWLDDAMARPRLELLGDMLPIFCRSCSGRRLCGDRICRLRRAPLPPLDRTSFARRAHVNCRRRAHRNRARLLDQVHAIQMFVKNNMQWFARPLRGRNSGVFDHVQTRRLVVDFATRISDQSRGHESAVPGNSIRALSEELTRRSLELPF